MFSAAASYICPLQLETCVLNATKDPRPDGQRRKQQNQQCTLIAIEIPRLEAEEERQEKHACDR